MYRWAPQAAVIRSTIHPRDHHKIDKTTPTSSPLDSKRVRGDAGTTNRPGALSPPQAAGEAGALTFSFLRTNFPMRTRLRMGPSFSSSMSAYRSTQPSTRSRPGLVWGVCVGVEAVRLVLHVPPLTARTRHARTPRTQATHPRRKCQSSSEWTAAGRSPPSSGPAAGALRVQKQGTRVYVWVNEGPYTRQISRGGTRRTYLELEAARGVDILERELPIQPAEARFQRLLQPPLGRQHHLVAQFPVLLWMLFGKYSAFVF